MAMTTPTPTSVRVDSWIWAVRLLRTRSTAAAECRAGHVSVNGEKAKPAQAIRIGDEVRLRGSEVERIVVVNRLLTKRVSAVVAAECLIDNTPPPPTREEAPAVITRERGAGRPTKRERRDILRLRGH
ncbi:MAG: ribosome-associated heat shock protein Hsp15 [Microbacteriaceae bacterium]|jgi:ribosome-associated heat shock protein Hsp15|nr:ribosome-associated heat shock protein Hsp15 [Microbacteriaceae bacterium]